MRHGTIDNYLGWTPSGKAGTSTTYSYIQSRWRRAQTKSSERFLPFASSIFTKASAWFTTPEGSHSALSKSSPFRWQPFLNLQPSTSVTFTKHYLTIWLYLVRDKWLLSCPRASSSCRRPLLSEIYVEIKAIERNSSVTTSSTSKLELLWSVFRCDFYEYTSLGSTSTTDGSSEYK